MLFLLFFFVLTSGPGAGELRHNARRNRMDSFQEDKKNFELKKSNVKDTITIVSKHDIFKIPVSATIMSYEQFEEENKQNMETAGKSIQNSRVRERLHRALLESRQSEKSEGPELLTKKPKEQEQKDGEDPLLAEVRRQ